MRVTENTIRGTRKSLSVNVGNVIAGTKMDIKKANNKEYQKEYRLNNKEYRKEYNIKYRLNNKEKIKEYYLTNKEKRREQQKEYKLNNREKINKQISNKTKTDPSFRLVKCLRGRLNHALNGTSKSKPTLKLLGCTIEQLWIHLEKQFQPGMTRDNHGEYHIDHIKPCASFDLTDPKQQAECFHYTNLQPLWATDNLSKGAKYDATL